MQNGAEDQFIFVEMRGIFRSFRHEAPRKNVGPKPTLMFAKTKEPLTNGKDEKIGRPRKRPGGGQWSGVHCNKFACSQISPPPVITERDAPILQDGGGGAPGTGSEPRGRLERRSARTTEGVSWSRGQRGRWFELDSDGEEEKVNPGRGQYSVGAGSLRGSFFFACKM